MGYPQGGDYVPRVARKCAPRFLHPDGANLDRVQVIKGWLDKDGKTHERIYDIAVSDGRARQHGRYRESDPHQQIRNAILAAYWEDPDFDPSEAAFYYEIVRPGAGN